VPVRQQPIARALSAVLGQHKTPHVSHECVLLPHLQVKLEEKSLLERYGQVYADYSAKVKRFFPYVY
jgi:protein-S-isoprenylcysteine O-methyltransferase Ste14